MYITRLHKKIDLYSPHNKNSEEDEKGGKNPTTIHKIVMFSYIIEVLAKN